MSGGQGTSNRKPSGSREASEQHRNGGSEPNLPVEEKMPALEERSEGEWRADDGSGEMCEEGEGGGRRETAGLAETGRPVSVSRLPPSMAPFPQLLTLSLANNLVRQVIHYSLGNVWLWQSVMYTVPFCSVNSYCEPMYNYVYIAVCTWLFAVFFV